MDIKRPPKSKIKKKIRNGVLIVVGLIAIGGITYGLTKLKPALATLERSTAVIETVKRVSGREFKVMFCGRRAGDPANIVAASERVRAVLRWQPRFDDLTTIVAHALAWERRLSARR